MMVAIWFTLITITQFHFMFYMSRTLPNIMALPLVISAITYWMRGHSKNFIIYSGMAIIIFRFELAILLGLLLAIALYTKKTTINELVQVAVPAGILILSATVIVDSFFWQRPLWPEGQVLWYNTILNKSSNWGTSPFLWYFYSAIPRAMGFSLLFVPVGLILEPRIRPLVLSAFLFVFLYSFLPHKELRFIIYIFPVLNIASACACNRLWINSGKSIWQGLLALIAGGHIILNIFLTLFLLVVSSTNYPGGVAMSRLHRIEANASNVSIHISNLAAQSGVSRFMEIRSDWSYDKKENLSFIETDMINYSHLLVEAKSKFNNDWTFLQENYETIEFVDCFSSIGIQYNSLLPVKVKTKPCIGIMKRKTAVTKKKITHEKRVERKPKVEKVVEIEEVIEPEPEIVLAPTFEKVVEIPKESEIIPEEEEPPVQMKTVQSINTTHASIEEDDGVVISNGDSLEEAPSTTQTREINFTELRNIALGKLTKTTRSKLREIIEQHYRSKGSVIENDGESKEHHHVSTSKLATAPPGGEKRNRMTVKSIIKQEKIKEMIEKISTMDLTKFCDLDKISTKDCLKSVIDEIDDNKNNNK
ncbi:probable Dol-P-Man:Man(7)GlcNAc(2)-PP-Dol alpha-1,6-mannosyltransferase isoform X2 [Episyrphus balteatus]|nr:probable Dol-P-Man:Man(7)GlcNAc(2)-PP-Dol alpha-1,6-mannosyltransferase isoform X2 [Episyrphus balteatus]